MRTFIGSLAGLVVVAVFGVSVASAGIPDSCRICTCQNEAIICVSLNAMMDELEEQGDCGGPCSAIGSSFQSSELTQTQCEDLPQCDFADTPAASPLWLSAGTLALVFLGGATLRRMRARTAS